MKFGVCYDLAKVKDLEELGFDYIEGHVTAVASMEKEAFEGVKRAIARSTIKAEAFCVLFPRSIALTGPEADLSRAAEYIDGVFPKLKLLGAESVVFGSGGARRVPEGFDRARAWHQLVSLGRMLGEKALENGLFIALEPLNDGETNIVNTQLEGLDLVRDVAHPGFRLLTDYYHLYLAKESTAEIAACAGTLQHAHFSNPVGRVLPKEGDGINYGEFFTGMKQGGYSRRLSYEGAIDSVEALAGTLALMKKQAAAAGIA